MKKKAFVILIVFLLLATLSCMDEQTQNIPFAPGTVQPSLAPTYYGYPCMVEGGEVNMSGLSLTARLVEALPDTYTFFDDWRQTAFRLLRMETITLLKGEAVTDTFYLRIPLAYVTDFSQFDRFVMIDVGQYSYDTSALYNQTQACAEVIDAVVLGFPWESHMNTNLMAFDAEGQLDSRLWQSTAQWISSTQGLLAAYEDGYTLAEAEEAARQEADDLRYARPLPIAGDEAAEALAVISNLENGVYVPAASGHNAPSGRFVRYIQGFYTNACIDIHAGGVTRSLAQFTEEELQSLPDLSSAIAAVEEAYQVGLISPPHIQNTEKLPKPSHGVFAWYAKTAQGVRGIIRVSWHFAYGVLDDRYYIVEPGGAVCQPIERDDLLCLLGEYETDYIYKGSYNEYGKTEIFHLG